MRYGQLEEIVGGLDPTAPLAFDDGAYVVAIKIEDGRVRLVRDDDVDCGWRQDDVFARDLLAGVERRHGVIWSGADVVVKMPEQSYCRYVEAGEDNLLKVGEMIW